MGKQKRSDLDLIRCLAIFFVIIVHGLSYIGFYELTDPSIVLYFYHTLRVIVISCVPLFLLLTGYLSGGKKYTFNAAYLKKPIRLLVIYILCAAVCSIPKLIKGEIGSVFIALLEFKAAPYAWYLAMYLGLYLMIPFLNAFLLANNVDYGLPVLVALVVLPTVTNNLNLGTIEWWNGNKEQATQILPNYWDELYPIMYYLIGYKLKVNDAIVYRLKNKKVLLGSVLVFSTVNYFKNLGNPFSWDWATSYGGYQCLIVSVMIFCIFLGLKIENQKFDCAVHSIAKYSFGMYLISWPIDIVVYKIANSLLPKNILIWSLPVTAFCVVVGSYICAVFIVNVADNFLIKINAIKEG